MADTPQHSEINEGSAPEVDAVIERYQAALKTATLSDEARERILMSLRQESAAQEASTRRRLDEKAASTHTHAARPAFTLRRLRQPLAVAAATAAVVVLAGGAGLFSAPTPAVEEPLATATTPASDHQAQGNFFTLKAWADEAPADNEAIAREPVAVNWLHPQYWDNNYDPEAPAVSGPTVATGIARTTFHFDALCEGENLAAVTWEIDGPDAWFSFNGEDATEGEADALTKSFTIDYRDDAACAAAEGRYLNVIAPLSDDMRQAAERLESDPARYWNELVPAGYAEAARALDGATLTLTATFEDGSTQAKTYRVGVVDNLEERCQEAARVVTAQWEENAGKVSDPASVPSPFTLTLVSAS